VSRLQKQYERLQSLDDELRALTIEALRQVERGFNTDFFIADYNNPWRAIRPSAQSNDIVNRAREIMRLAEMLSESTAGLAASVILKCFDGANDLSNPHRLGPIRLASSLREKLEALNCHSDYRPNT